MNGFSMTFDPRGVSLKISKEQFGSVAQLAEQGIHKPRVTGSSPVAAIK
jgi:hypothetical protein